MTDNAPWEQARDRWAKKKILEHYESNKEYIGEKYYNPPSEENIDIVSVEFEEGGVTGGCITCETFEPSTVEIIWRRLDLIPKSKLHVNISLSDLSFDQLLQEIIQAALV